MKRTLRVMLTAALTIAITTIMVFGTATDTYAATSVSKKVIPSTTVKADSRVVDAFVDLGFEVRYDKNMKDYAGVFSVGQHAVILKYKDKTNTLHEMGHFVSRLQKGADETTEFVKIYKAEKKNYNGKLQSYIKASSKEYFAQSFAEYTTSPKMLKSSRPKTYAYVKAQVEAIDQQDVDDMYAAYGWAW